MSSKNTAIRAALESIIAAAEPAWRQSVIDRFLARAAADLAWWKSYVSGETKRSFGEPTASHRYVSYPKIDGIYSPDAWRVGSNPDNYVANTAPAERDAIDEYTLMRETFLGRCEAKIIDMAGDMAVELTGDIQFHGMMTGTLHIVVAGKTKIDAEVSVRANYRYGHNAANGRLTCYAQYPFDIATLTRDNGMTSCAVGIADVAEATGSKTIERQQRASADQKEARLANRAKKHALEDQRALLSELADSLAWIDKDAKEGHTTSSYTIGRRDKAIAGLQKLGLEVPATAKAARAARKIVMEARKALPKG